MTNQNDFEVAKSVSDLLKGIDAERQARVLRWVSESLGIVQSSYMPITSPPGSGGSQQIIAPQGLSSGATDIKTFVAAKDPKSDNQFAAVVAYYYRFESPQNQRLETINADTLQEATRLSGRSRLGDPGKTLRNATAQGYLDAADRGSYKINTVGENLVAMTLSGQSGTAAPRARKTKSIPKAKR